MPLHRSNEHKVIAGVCGGIAEFIGWSPTLVRVLWVILTPTTLFAGGVLYLLLWLLMPKAQADTLSSQAEATLAALVPQLAKEKGAITVEGHTDAKGSDDYNQKLSERRARAVRDWLAAHHHLAAATTAVGYGESQPVAPNARPDGGDHPAGREKNRRVEVVIATCPAPG